MMHYVIVPDGAAVPTSAEVVSGTGAGGAGQVACGSVVAVGNTPVTATVAGVSPCPDPPGPTVKVPIPQEDLRLGFRW